MQPAEQFFRIDHGVGNNTIAAIKRNTRQPLGQQRAEFLRSCRARLNPCDVGLPEPQRKRTAGLRREDVAALSGVSVAWYTWLEQGREMRVSDDVLERISHTFRLTEDERVYLFSLVQQRAPRVQHDPALTLPPEVDRLVKGTPMPAIAMNLRWDVLTWNEFNTQVFRDYSLLEPGERNLIEILFTQPSYHKASEDSAHMLRRILAKLRVDYSTFGKDPKFEALIQKLDRISPQFHSMWRTPDINVGSYGVHRFNHAKFGELAFEHVSCMPDGHPTIRVVICLPSDERTRQVLAKLK
jgi:hypothetical protein